MSKQGGLSTGDVAGKVLEKEPEKLKEELKSKQKELGLRDMIPKGNQDLLQQLTDIGVEASHIKEQMAEAKERRLKRTAEERKAKVMPMNERLRLYLMKQERQAKQAYDSRRIVFHGGGFSQYEDSIIMTSYRVLLKKIDIGERNDGGIVIPESNAERFPKYKVIAVGAGSDGIEEGMTVIVEPYAGTEVVSDENIYLILTCCDILGTAD